MQPDTLAGKQVVEPLTKADFEASALHRDELRRTGTAVATPGWSDTTDGDA